MSIKTVETVSEGLKRAYTVTIPAKEIEARLGAVWISPQLHQQFLEEVLEDRSVRVENPMPGEWEVRSRGADVGGKLVVIGSKLDEKAIAALFGC